MNKIVLILRKSVHYDWYDEFLVELNYNSKFII